MVMVDVTRTSLRRTLSDRADPGPESVDPASRQKMSAQSPSSCGSTLLLWLTSPIPASWGMAGPANSADTGVVPRELPWPHSLHFQCPFLRCPWPVALLAVALDVLTGC